MGPLATDDHVAVSGLTRSPLSDLCADRGISGLICKLRARRGATADVNEREQGEETADRTPVTCHRLCSPSREGAGTMQP